MANNVKQKLKYSTDPDPIYASKGIGEATIVGKRKSTYDWNYGSIPQIVNSPNSFLSLPKSEIGLQRDQLDEYTRKFNTRNVIEAISGYYPPAALGRNLGKYVSGREVSNLDLLDMIPLAKLKYLKDTPKVYKNIKYGKVLSGVSNIFNTDELLQQIKK